MTICGEEPKTLPQLRIPDIVVVRFQPNTTASEIEAFAGRYQEYGLAERRHLDKGMSLFTTKHFFYDKSLVDGRDLVGLIRKEKIVDFAQLDYQYSLNSVIACFTEGTTEDDIVALVKKFSEFELRLEYWSRNSIRGFGDFSFNSKLVDLAHIMHYLNKEAIVEFLLVDTAPEITTFIPPDPYFPQQTYLTRIKMPQTWTLLNSFQGNARTKVAAVIDRGFYNSRELIDGRAVNWGEFAPPGSGPIYDPTSTGVAQYVFDGIDNDGNGFIDDFFCWNAMENPPSGSGRLFAPAQNHYLEPELPHLRGMVDTHGTLISNIISARSNVFGITGMTLNYPDQKHFPIDVTAPADTLFSSIYRPAMNRALNYVLQMRRAYNNARHADPDSVPAVGMKFVSINLSSSFIKSRFFANNANLDPTLVEEAWQERLSNFQAFVDSLGAEGVLTVVSAGNNSLLLSTDEGLFTGIESDYLIAVTSVDGNNNLANFANYGANRVHISAPGTSLLNIIDNGITDCSNHVLLPNTYGTSYSAPMVVGCINLMYRAISEDILREHDMNRSWGELAKSVRKNLLDAADNLLSMRPYVEEGRFLNVYEAVKSVKALQENIDTDITFDAVTDTLNHLYIIVDGAVVRYQDSFIITPITNSDFKLYGFRVVNGKLIADRTRFKS
jgi:hypothetical protein